jgi:hypothetical protein
MSTRASAITTSTLYTGVHYVTVTTSLYCFSGVFEIIQPTIERSGFSLLEIIMHSHSLSTSTFNFISFLFSVRCFLDLILAEDSVRIKMSQQHLRPEIDDFTVGSPFGHVVAMTSVAVSSFLYSSQIPVDQSSRTVTAFLQNVITTVAWTGTNI